MGPALVALLLAGPFEEPEAAPAPPAPAEAAAPAVAAPEPEVAVLVYRSGQKLVVRSYRVDGRLVRAVDEAGAPVLLKTEQIDLDRSEAATLRERAARRRAAEEATAAAVAAAERAAQKARQREKIEAQRAARKTRGTMNVGPEIAPAQEPSQASTAGAVAPAGRPAEGLPAGLKQRAGELLARRKQLVSEHNRLAAQLADDPMADYASGEIKLKAIRDEVAAIDRELDRIEERRTAR